MVTQKRGSIPMAKLDDKPITGRFGAILSSLGPKKIHASEITKKLKGYGKDFDTSKVEEKLGIPKGEFREIQKETGATYYVFHEMGNMEQVVDGIRRGERIAPAGVEYAIIFVGGSSSVDIMIVDSAKKTVIKRRVYAAGSDGYEKIWTKIGEDLEKAHKAATSDKYVFLVEGRGI